MQFFLFGCLFTAVVSLLAGCGSGGGGGGSTVPLKLDGLSVYDYQTPSSTKDLVSKAASYPDSWNGTGTVTPPHVEPIVSVYADGTTVTRDGTIEKPFLKTQLATAKIQDPNAVVRSVSELTGASTVTGYKGTDYDLRWGTPDTKGPSFAKQYDSGSWQSADPLYFWGQKLNGCSILLAGTNCTSKAGPSLAAPAQDVLDAWNLGWTGKGVNILMEDLLTGTDKNHGVITSVIASQFAPGSNLYGLDVDRKAVNKNVVDKVTGETLISPIGQTIKIGVVNASFVGKTPNGNYSAVIDRYNNVSYQGQVNYTDAVITKAAGNDSQDSQNEPVNKALTLNSKTNTRLLIVGALTQAGSTTSPVDIADYSNTAGKDAAVSSRYLLASGTVPFVTGGLVVDGTTVQADTKVGTSFAAPRVAGMVAIVRSKFPNLNASQTASILLDTARYDTLLCSKNGGVCDPAIYGKGEASLSRALAPVGKLR